MPIFKSVRHADSHTQNDDVKTITPVTDAGCKKACKNICNVNVNRYRSNWNYKLNCLHPAKKFLDGFGKGQFWKCHVKATIFFLLQL